jgi:hypothetical protein
LTVPVRLFASAETFADATMTDAENPNARL